ncbi:unnamed protein product [Penicillium camemberti]|uniref:Str. FM013 n=1 Tax=Penicillium camemberti (strain FM 013) TaxID=1429867 RepID=A0A0G4PBD4_PENC3|nr:unnamed protein product [Penicillium camemberti]
MSLITRLLLSNLLGYESPESVAVTSAAERKDMEMIDNKANSLVWATGCTSWFIDETTGQNTIIYPDYEFKFWFRSVLVPWKDMVTRSGHQEWSPHASRNHPAPCSCSCSYVCSFGYCGWSPIFGQG